MPVSLIAVALAAAAPVPCAAAQSALECLLVREAGRERPLPTGVVMEAASPGSVTLRYRARVIELGPAPTTAKGVRIGSADARATQAPSAVLIVETIEFMPVEESAPASDAQPVPPRT